MYYVSGNRYEAEFKDGKMNGKGIFYYVDGRKQYRLYENN